jgi:hypothetical protein
MARTIVGSVDALKRRSNNGFHGTDKMGCASKRVSMELRPKYDITAVLLLAASSYKRRMTVKM